MTFDKIIIKCSIKAVKRVSNLAYLNIIVVTDGYPVFAQKNIVISSTCQIDPVAVAKIVGILYRKACSVMPATVPSPLKATFATKRWSPFRISSMASALMMHTHDTRFNSLCLTPAAIDSMSFLASTSMPADNTTVHLHYKGHTIEVVIRRSGENRSSHTVHYPAKLVLTIHEYSGYRWLGEETSINHVVSSLWQLLVTAL